MPRTKTVVPGRRRRKKVMKAVKGNFQGRRKLFQTCQGNPAALDAVRLRAPPDQEARVPRALDHAHQRRRAHPRALVLGAHLGLKSAEITINRKVLADLAVNDMPAFAQLAEVAKQAQAV
jgi:large subunit ribosomal protein L20